MPVQILGQGGQLVQVDVTHRALRQSARPLDHGTLGHYRFSSVSGILPAALAANAVVFSARWGDATRFAIITSFRTRFLPEILFTGGTLTDHTSFDLFIGRTFTASHTGGTAITPSKMRASMGATLFTDIRIASTAALGGGGVVLDAFPIAQSLRKGNRVNPAAATEEVIQPSSDGLNINMSVSDGEYPIVLAQSEGLVLRNRTVWPAAGTGLLLVEMAWAEVVTYDNAQLG
jgi:hypothetical protein